MSFKLNTIRDNPGAMKVRKVVGRGIGSGLGKTSGRGGKGQTARAGCSLNGFEGGQMPIYRRLPQRGFKSRNAGTLFEFHIRKLDSLIKKGVITEDTVIDASFLISTGMMPRYFKGVSLIAMEGVNMPLKFRVARVSKSAKAFVEGAGGVVEVV
ncbi:MAG: 50S ribosomal protein L15 [Holosporales bacterium]|jgi:large subunit ribosomal protein L15|nr:50S ribosomal protein L15 [Holosporales bacterium]